MKNNSVLPQIKKIVFLMLENRSLDNVLGWLYQGDSQPKVFFPESDKKYDGLQKNTFSNPDAEGAPLFVQPIPDGIWNDNKSIPYHDPYEAMVNPPLGGPLNGVMNQFFGGENMIDRMPTADDGMPKMKGFFSDYYSPTQTEWHGHDILWSYTPEQLPVINSLAKQFAVSDCWFSSVPTDTNPNRAYSLCGTSIGRSSNENIFAVEQFQTTTVFNYLSDLGKSWGIYYKELWHGGKPYTTYTFPQIPTQLDKTEVAPIQIFFDHLENGTLPDFSYLEPSWTNVILRTDGTDYHPPCNPLNGSEQFLHSIYDAVRKSVHWEEILFVITFDEHGGTYDHVAPPWTAINPDGLHGQNYFNFDLFGARVPTILVSPFVPEGAIFRPPQDSKYPFDHTSLLKTILCWAGADLAHVELGSRMTVAPTFEDIFSNSIINHGVADFCAPPFATSNSPSDFIVADNERIRLLQDVPVIAARVLLERHADIESLTRAIKDYWQDQEKFEHDLARELGSLA